MAETSLLRSPGIVRNGSPNITSAQPSAQLGSKLKTVNVSMGNAQQQGQQTVKSGVVVFNKAPAQRFRTGELADGKAKSAVAVFNKDGAPVPANARGAAKLKEVQPLSADQLMLCRHLVDTYAKAEGTEDVALATSTIVAIDASLKAITAAEALVEQREQLKAQAQQNRQQIVAGGRSAPGSLQPKRFPRLAGPPPAPVVVRMGDEGKPELVEGADGSDKPIIDVA